MNRVINKANKKLSLSNAALLLIVATLLTQLLGFFRLRLVAANFSQSATDAYFAAFQIPDFFYLTIAAGVLGVAFMPVIAERLHAGDRKAIWDITSSLLNLMFIVMLVAAVFIFIFAEPLIHHIVGPGLKPVPLHQATIIMRIVALNPLLFTISGILTSAQQTFGRFFFFALAPLMYNLAIIVSIYVFKYHLGVIGLGIGAVIGASLQLAVASLGLWGLKFKWKPRIKLTSDFKLIMRKLPARAIDQGVDSINSIVETNRATILRRDGAVTSYNLASSIMNVPVMLFGTTIATAAFPRLNDRLAQGRNDLFHKEFFTVVRAMVWIAMPVTVVTFFTRGYLARLIFASPNPDIAIILGFLSVAIFARIMYTIISRYFYAKKDTSTPLFVSLFVIALNIVLVFSLAKPGEYGIAGLAIAQSIAASAEIVILVTIMFIRDRYIFNAVFWGALLKIVSVTGFCIVTAFIMVSILPLEAADKGITLGVKFALITTPILLVYLGVSYLFGLDEAKIVINKTRKLILKPLQIQ